MSYKPRDALEVMMATQCIVMRLAETATLRDAGRPDVPAQVREQNRKLTLRIDKQVRDTEKMLKRWQSGPLRKMNPALFQSLGLDGFLISDPDDPEGAEEAASAVIVPLHPAPKSLQ